MCRSGASRAVGSEAAASRETGGEGPGWQDFEEVEFSGQFWTENVHVSDQFGTFPA